MAATDKKTTTQILNRIKSWANQEFIRNTANNLVNYYLKSETYTKAEVQQIVDAIKQFTYEVVQVLPTASASTMNKIYLVPAPKSEDKNIKEEYITIQNGSTYTWEMLGTTSIDLSNYYTKGQTDAAITAALNSALANYTTTADLDISLSVVAEALLYLYNENKALRDLLAGKDNAVLPVVKAQSVECDDILTLGVPNVLYSSVAGAPSATNIPDNWNEETMTVWDGCPRKIGQQYVDKASKKVYYAVAVTESTSDWVVLN